MQIRDATNAAARRSLCRPDEPHAKRRREQDNFASLASRAGSVIRAFIEYGAKMKNAIITLLLILAVIATGAMAYYWRDQWWQLYLGYVHQ
jgi:hypothetical protein